MLRSRFGASVASEFGSAVAVLLVLLCTARFVLMGVACLFFIVGSHKVESHGRTLKAFPPGAENTKGRNVLLELFALDFFQWCTEFLSLCELDGKEEGPDFSGRQMLLASII